MGRGESKFRNRKVVVDGFKFDSIRESERYKDLLVMQRGGVISGLQVQPRFQLMCGTEPIKIRSDRYPNGRKIYYYADFKYTDNRRGVEVAWILRVAPAGERMALEGSHRR